MLHDVGKIVLNENVGEAYQRIVRMVNEARISFTESERRVLGVTHPEVGELVARRWKLPDPIPNCIRYHHEPSALPEPDLMVDIVHLADAACLLMGIGGGDDSPMYAVDFEALERVGLTETELEGLGVAIAVEVRSIRAMFGME